MKQTNNSIFQPTLHTLLYLIQDFTQFCILARTSHFKRLHMMLQLSHVTCHMSHDAAVVVIAVIAAAAAVARLPRYIDVKLMMLRHQRCEM